MGGPLALLSWLKVPRSTTWMHGFIRTADIHNIMWSEIHFNWSTVHGRSFYLYVINV